MKWSREKSVPAALFFLLALAAYVVKINFLYGQGAQVYLAQTEVLFGRMNGQLVTGMGSTGLWSGYALLAALLTFITHNAIISLQLITWGSAAVAVHFFLAGCRYLLPGSKTESRFLYGVFFLSAPVFIKSSLLSLPDIPALALTLVALRYGLDAGEHRHGRLLVWAVLSGSLSVMVCPEMTVLVAPVLLWAVYRLVKSQLFWVIIAGLTVGLAAISQFWVQSALEASGFTPAGFPDFSLLNLFKRHFPTTGIGTRDYFLPNGLYLFSPLAHYGFFSATFLLFFLFRKTDIHLLIKKLLLGSVIAYLLIIGSLPVQSIRYLLPVWAVGLWLLFPAWDRFYAYGLYFFSGLTKVVLWVGLAIQVAGIIWLWRYAGTF